MLTKSVIVVLSLLAMVNRSLSRSCLQCYEVDCGPSPTCSYGVTKDVCRCCDICEKGPGELCGGSKYGSRCGDGFECKDIHNIHRVEHAYYYELRNYGICVEQGDIALIIAASNNNSDIVTTLLENGANPNNTNLRGDIALIIAASNNYSDIVTTLLENGANPSITIYGGQSALINAAEKDYSDIVTTLLNFGANPNMKYQYGYTALSYAAEYNNSDIVTILLEYGANPNIRNTIGDTALIIAASNNQSDIVTTLLENGANSNITNCRGNTALIKAASNNYSDIVTKLLENGANPNTINVYGCGGEYNSSSGTIRFPSNGCYYQNNEHCIWIIRAEDPIKITFVTLEFEYSGDHLYVLDGDSLASNVIGNFTKYKNNNPSPLETTTNAAYLLFTSHGSKTRSGFELTWELIEMQPPTTEPPTTQLPNTEPPATQPPITESPTTQPPGIAVPETYRRLRDTLPSRAVPDSYTSAEVDTVA